ncbi:MAG: hypothetical protein HC926_04990, partial [Synechococcaceae cyanobacterium SM2_3_60]|nr:hypothetical protein [Synechococcaceae cyanobacterium SM2_3_60]
RTLAVASITGETFELAPSQGSLQQAEFAPMQPRLFLSRGQLDPETFNEFPELVAIDWETGLEVQLASSDEPSVLHFSLSPDGRELLYSFSSLDNRAVTALWHLDLGQRPVVATPLDVQLRDVAWVP